MSKLNFLCEVTQSVSRFGSEESIANCFKTYEKDPLKQVMGGVSHYQHKWLLGGNEDVAHAALNAFILGLMVAEYAETPEGEKMFKEWIEAVKNFKQQNGAENVISINTLRENRKNNG